jgi:hypothetical protein
MHEFIFNRSYQNDPKTVFDLMKRDTAMVDWSEAKCYMICHTDRLFPEILALLNANPKLEVAVHLPGAVPHTDLEFSINRSDDFALGCQI